MAAWLKDVSASLAVFSAALRIAALIAPPLALLLGYFWLLRSLILPLITLIRPIPPIAWIPLAILWFGLGDPPSYFITALAAFFPIFLSSFAGAQALQEEHVNAARSLGAKTGALLTLIMLPSALPQIVTGLRIGLGQAWMAVVTAELIAAQSGLGFMIQASRLNLETSRVLVGMTLIGILGATMTALLGLIERRLIVPWNYTNAIEARDLCTPAAIAFWKAALFLMLCPDWLWASMRWRRMPKSGSAILQD